MIEDNIVILSVNYVRRESNRVAHRLAKEALSIMDEQVHLKEALNVL